MNIQFHPYAIILLISSLTTLITSVIVLRREVPGAVLLGGTLLGSFIWSGAYALSWSLVEPGEKLFWLKVAYLGVLAVPSLFLVFTLQVTHNETWLTGRSLLMLVPVPVVMLTLLWLRTDLFFGQIGMLQREGFVTLHLPHSAGYWINTFYSYGLIGLALVILTLSARRANQFFRRQYLVIMLAATVPFAASVFTQISYPELADFDLAPMSFAVSSILFVYAIFRYQFMDLLPIARGHLIESMSDGVLVLDAQDRIVDINPAMKGFVGEDTARWLGKDFDELLQIWSYHVSDFLDGLDTHAEIKLPSTPVRYLDLRMTRLFDERNQPSGRLIVFRDVTDRKEVEKDLRRAMDRLQTQLIEIGVLQSQLREQAIRDALTGVFNRRYLEETLKREVARAERERYPLCVIMMDLDFFKEVNDTHGHAAGDEVLKALAETVTRQSRNGDFVCRYGGEEFVLVMPNIGLDTASERAEDLHTVINAMQVPFGDLTLNTTISMGLAMFPEHGRTKEELLRAADRAMYIAKNTGRNRVVVYPESELNPN